MITIKEGKRITCGNAFNFPEKEIILMPANSRQIINEVIKTTHLDKALPLLLLLGLGIGSLSMTPSSLPRVKWTIRSFAIHQVRRLAEKALKIDNEADTHRLLNRALKAAGLCALVREN